jgi:Zn-dependent protease with chaperone function
MKRTIKVLAAFLVFAVPVFAQQTQTAQQMRAQMVNDFSRPGLACNDPSVLNDARWNQIPHTTSAGTSEKDGNFILCIEAKLIRNNRVALPPGFGRSWGIALVHSGEINSRVVFLTNGIAMVEAYDSMARFLNYDPDEEAFVIAHEIGHIQDAARCNASKARIQQSFIHTQAMFNEAQRKCEEHADYYGLQYMWGAGFNPYAAGAAMGRFEMYLPDQTRGLGSILNNFISDHPIGSERVKKLREEMLSLCSRPGTVCQSR